VLLRLQPRRAPVEDQLDALVVLPIPIAEGQVPVAKVAGEQALGEWRAVVRELRLSADDPDTAVIAAAAERLGEALGKRGRRR
jgi:hypothetical protein